MSIWRRFSAMAAAAVTLTALPAMAQPESGRRIDSTPRAVKGLPGDKDDAGRIVLNQYSRCYAQKYQTRAIDALEYLYLSPEQDKAVAKLNRSMPDCLGHSGLTLRFSAPAMVGGMAEELVLENYGSKNLAAVSALTEDAMFASGFKPRNNGEDFAQCVARSNSAGAYALLQTDVGSEAETKAVKTLVPVLGSCLVTGQNINLNEDTVRSLSAVGLYRILSGLAASNAGK